jgi:copper chaperone NosL
MQRVITHALNRFYEFLDQAISLRSRLVLVLLCVPLLLSVTQPLWRISMEAPQYPNGLWFEIYAHRLESGSNGQDLKEVNTLNHYIGMHPIDVHDLTELGWMPFAIGILLILTLRVAAIGNVRALIDLAVLAFYTLGFMSARFAYRMYVYGHDLAPTAPFKIQPFTPAIFGTKQIANFTTHSFPQLGTILLSGFALGVAGVALWQLLSGRRAAMGRPSWPVRKPPG